MGLVDYLATGDWNHDYSNKNVVMRAGEPVPEDLLADLQPAPPPGGYGPDLATAVEAAKNKIWSKIPFPGFGISFTAIAVVAVAIVGIMLMSKGK